MPKLIVGGTTHWTLELKDRDEVNNLILELEEIRKQDKWPYIWAEQRQMVEVPRG